MDLPTATDALLGRRARSDVGTAEYLFESKLGVGGTAAAYLTRRIATDGVSPAVVKVILPEVVELRGETAAAVFLKEAVALGRLNERVPPSPFVVRLLDTGSVPFPWKSRTLELPWLALEYVSGGTEGTTLNERVERTKRLTGFAFDRDRAARALNHIASGLDEVHAVGVIHRDLTPSNVLCCSAGTEEIFKLSDFGIAKPSGVSVTFGATVVGTPGYMALEQITGGRATATSDVFSFACVAYFVLTGEEYIGGSNVAEIIKRVTSRERRHLADTDALCPELRQDKNACDLLDDALARATLHEPDRRFPSARALASVIVPCLLENIGQGSERYLSALTTQRSPVLPTMSWIVRHPPGDDVAVQSTGWDGDGQCLAVTSRGLRHWNGCKWADVPLDGLASQMQPRFVRRIAAGRWMVGGDSATLFEYTRSGVTRVIRGKHSGVSFLEGSGSVEDLAAVVGQASGSPPMLYGLSGGRWLRPLPVSAASVVTGLAQLDDERWLVVGRTTAGQGFVAVYAPLEWSLAPIETPPTRAFLACASRQERGVALAVGAEGAVVRIDQGRTSGAVLDGRSDLACAAIDVLDPSWTRPFVSIHADVGSIVAMTADGGILECRASLSRIL
jgi:eukaryotic-like serine/threonine-protein kinase